jgi:rRNA maturation endonuclease Nob1
MEERIKYNVLDTAYFIKMKPLSLNEGMKYITTEFIVHEIRDENAKNFYTLNKDFIEVRNPSRENMKIGN